MPSLARVKKILKSACLESGREVVTTPGSGVSVEHGQEREAVKLLDRLRP